MKSIQIETFRSYHFLSAPAFSKQGSFISVIVKKAEGNGYTSNLYTASVQDKQLIQKTFTGNVRHSCWMADDVLLYAVPAGEKTEFFSLNVKSGENASVFTLPVKTLQTLVIDADTLLVLAEYKIPGKYNAPDAPYDVFDELPFRWNAQGLVNGLRKRLYLYHIAAKEMEAITDENFYVGNLTTTPWTLSANERYVLFIGQRLDDGVQKTYTGLWSYDLATRKMTCHIPDGRQKVEITQLLGDQAIVTTAPGDRFGSCEMGEFYRLDLPTGKMELLSHYDYSVGMAITTDSTLGGGCTNKAFNGRVYFTTMEGHSTRIRSIGLDGSIGEPLTGEGSVNGFDLCGDDLAYIGMFGNQLQELYLNEEQISHLNDEILTDYTISTPVLLTSQREGGELVEGWVIPPVDYKPGTSYPAILNIHGGPHAAFGPTFFHEMQVWANAGYFVLYCNPHGSDGYGNAFGDMRGIYGTIDYDDIMTFTDQALAAWSDIDPSRVGVTGGSYGGYMTNWIIGHTDRFRCAVAQRSISDWALSELCSDAGFQRNVPKMGASVLDDLQKVYWHSPITYARNVKTPTLFLHSYEDYRCHHSQAIAMYTAIRQRGIDSRLCIFKGENHELSRSGKPNNRVARMTELMNWMDKYLK